MPPGAELHSGKSHGGGGRRESAGCSLTRGAQNPADAQPGFGEAFIGSPAVMLGWGGGHFLRGCLEGLSLKNSLKAMVMQARKQMYSLKSTSLSLSWSRSFVSLLNSASSICFCKRGQRGGGQRFWGARRSEVLPHPDLLLARKDVKSLGAHFPALKEGFLFAF